MTAIDPTRPAAEQLPRVTVRYWAAARAAAGVSEEVLEGVTVADLLVAALDAHRDSDRFARVLGVCSLMVGEHPIGLADPARVVVADGDVLEVLPPFAGG